MPSLFFQDMKGVNLACTTPASTAICASIADRAVASPGGGGGGGGRAIDRHNPHLHDHRRAKPQAKPVPQPSSKNFRYFNIKKSKKSKKSSEQPICGQISPGSSSRFLLDNDIKLSDVFAEPMELTRSQSCKREEVHELVDVKLKASSSTRPQNQVVILRVSLHCKGCEGKVRKHISKMEGVKSFSIDFAAKKVTVIGEVTPLGVLNSISKVKNAQFWPSSADSPVASF